MKKIYILCLGIQVATLICCSPFDGQSLDGGEGNSLSNSAGNSDETAEAGEISLRQSVRGITWSLSMAEGPYRFTDRIGLTLTLAIDDQNSTAGYFPQDIVIQPGAEHWGDFRVRWLGRRGSRWEAILIPRRSGECRLSIPVFAHGKDHQGSAGRGEEPLLRLEPDLMIQVESLLEEDDSEPAPLLPGEKEGAQGLVMMLSVLCIVSAGIISLLVIMKHKKKRRETEDRKDAGECLECFLKEAAHLPSEEEVRGLYRRLFRLLLAELDGRHPGIRGRGYGPSELAALLEVPSALNQWNMRSLYPLLGRMEDIFFSPDSSLPTEDEYQEHRRMIKTWLTMVKEENREI